MHETASASGPCDAFAAPWGSDGAPGTRLRPVRTPGRLLRGLRPGQTGCLRGGTYRGDIIVRRQGLPGRPLTLRSAPGEGAALLGRLLVHRRSRHLVFRELHLDGRNRRRLPSPTVNGDDILFEHNAVTNRSSGICFNLGHPRYGRAERVTLRRNTVHHCGRRPATNHDHGVYVARAVSTTIVDNWIHDNADRGIQLYPDAQLTYVAGNVIARNGQGLIFSGAGGISSNDNVVEGNVIAGSRLRHNVESFYPAGTDPGSGNELRRNCVSGGARASSSGGVQLPAVGFTATDNLTADPAFARRSLVLSPRSVCRRVFLGTAGKPGPRVPAPSRPRRIR